MIHGGVIYIPYLAQDQGRQLGLQEEPFGLGAGNESCLRLECPKLFLVLQTLPRGHSPRIHRRVHFGQTLYPSFHGKLFLFIVLFPYACVLVRSLRLLLSTHQIQTLSLRTLFAALFTTSIAYSVSTTPTNFHNGFLWFTYKAFPKILSDLNGQVVKIDCPLYSLSEGFSFSLVGVFTCQPHSHELTDK